MKHREYVVDLVKAAFVLLIIKVMASTSELVPWSSFLDNACTAFAIGVMLLKLATLTFPLGKFLALASMSLLVLYTSVAIRQYDLLVSIVAICLLINEDLEEYIALMLRIQVWVLIAHVVVSLCLCPLGYAEEFWQNYDGRLRFYGGFKHSNVLSCYIQSCMLMFAWLRFSRITPNQFAGMACITFLTFFMSKSRTGLLLNILLLVLIFLTQNGNRLIRKIIDPILVLIFPCVSAILFLAMKQYIAGSSAAMMLNSILTGRIKLAAYAYLRSGVTWLPRFLDYALTGYVAWTEEWGLNTFAFDSLYSLIFMELGMIWIIVISVMIIMVHKKFDFRNKIFILFLLIFSIVEVHGLNCIRFFPLILFSGLLSGKGAEDHKTCSA